MTVFAIFVGAGLGGVTRYALSAWIQDAAGAGFPWGTLVVNVSGSLLLTFGYAVLEGTTAPAEWRAFLGIGILGGYTTFSTFSYETLALLKDGEWTRAGFYAVASVLLSLAATFLGFALAREAIAWRTRV